MSSKSINSQKQNQNFSMDDFAKALEKYDYQFEKGQIVTGKPVEYTPEGAYIDIGAKSLGFLPNKEISTSRGNNLLESLPLQEEREFLIISGQDENGQVTLSLKQLEINEAWEKVKEIFESGRAVELVVTGVNKGGVTGEVEGLRGFIPRSHLSQKNNLESLIGQYISANFLEVDKENNKLVLSQRQIMKAAAYSKIETGQVVEGKVTKIQPYGVFVDLNGVSALLHIKQVSGAHIDSLGKIFNIYQDIKVMIVEVDEVKNRISVSTKILENYPGEIIENFAQVMDTAFERAEKAKSKLSE